MKFLTIATLLAVTAPLAHAEIFDLTGASVGGTLQTNGFTYVAGPATFSPDGDLRLEFNLNFDQGPDAPAFAILLDNYDSDFLFLDRQGTLAIGNTSSTPFTFASGLSLTITGLFAAPGSSASIGGFELVSNGTTAQDDLIASLALQYEASSGTLVIQSLTDIEIPDLTTVNLSGRFLAAAIPEPASTGVLAGIAALIALGLRRQRR